MNLLVINSGSSSLKFKLFKTGKELQTVAEGLIDKIGSKDCRLSFKNQNKNLGIKSQSKNHTEALKEVLELLKKTETIKSVKEINVVGHRVVHGGEKFTKPTKIDAKVIKEIEKISRLAPLHNPTNLQCVKTAKKLFPKSKHIAVFDTAFYKTLEEKAFLYAIPTEFYEKHGIRRYGFHGTNHEYVTTKAITLLNNKKNLKIISVHLGNGSSITASVDGKATDTTMGFTPLEGLIMGTRSGSIDPSIPLEIQKIKKLKPQEVDDILNHKSGLLALSGISSDMREIYKASLQNNSKANLTIEYLSYQIAKYIGGFVASLNGVNAIVFTGTMGEKAFYVREKACEYLSHIGVELDKKKNKLCEQTISSKNSKVKVFVIKADEELQIAINLK